MVDTADRLAPAVQYSRPIASGLLVATALLLTAEFSPGLLGLNGNAANPYWLWSVLPQWDFPIPRAFLIVPIVGAFLIDFVNAILTTAALNFFR